MKLAIKGHSTRGKEVIEILKMMGGYNIYDSRKGNQEDLQYFINNKGNIDIRYHPIFNNNNYKVFTLEEFLKKYPFKIGDKVIDCYGNSVTIKSMKWSEEFETMVYDFDETEHVLRAEDIKTANDIHTKPSKMKNILAALRKHFETTSKEELEQEFEEIKEWSNVGPTVEEFRTFYECVNKKPKYPTTYEECCDILSIPPYYNLRYHTYEPRYNEYTTSNTLLSLQDKLNTLSKLIICRDAYWKIAGKQMGLDKPWEHVYVALEDNTYFTIQTFNSEIDKNKTSYRNVILAFPTEEMRDTFYENFKNLIEQCKKIL